MIDMAASSATTQILVAFSTLFIMLILWHYIEGDRLFGILKARYPKYYKKLGRPLYYGDPFRGLQAIIFLVLLAFRGLPKDFPDDVDLRPLVLELRELSCG